MTHYSNTKLRKMYYDTHSHIEYHPTVKEHSKAFAIVIAIIATLVIVTLAFA